jgi:TetR/AcrR family transcriptional regulator, regulator of autoinduction and epiphytic fitness
MLAMATVKTRKPTRAERARSTRRRMIDSARELFVAQGYAATTMAQIAADAGVAVQTVYYTFRTKGQLLGEVVEVTAAGEDVPVPTAQRAWVHEMLAAIAAQRVLALGIEHGPAIYERVAVLWPAVAAAAVADASVDQYWRGVAAHRRGGQRAMVTRIAELGGLHPDLDVERATDLVVVLAGHDVYRGLVLEAGWTVSAYKAWLFTTLVQQLLGTRNVDVRATGDLSLGGLVQQQASLDTRAEKKRPRAVARR